MNTPERSEYRVDVRTQFDTALQRTREWSFFANYSARSKADAVKQARTYNARHGCFDKRTNGLVWFRATLSTDQSPNP